MGGSGIRLESGHVLEERYLLEKVIGQGGMGTVFAARHLELDERVAVKVLQSESAFHTLEAEHLERFVREARLAAKIKNEHVVRIIDVARDKNGAPPYIVMELLDGCDLGDLSTSRGRLPVPEAVGYVLQACEALAEAHGLGIVHRDLKPSNLHLSQRSDGSPLVKVLDFGISKVHDDASDPNLTATSSVFGSPAYMSPEQIRSSKHVDARTDVWAITVVLYELITQQLPFAGTNPADMLGSITNAPHIPLRKFAPETDIALEHVMRAALAKVRDARTPSIAAFAAALAPFADAAGAASIATIQRIASRPRGIDNSSIRSGSIPAPAGPAGGTDDTMRAPPPMMVPSPGETPPWRASAPPTPSIPVPPRAEALRTDRAMAVPPRGGTSSAPFLIAIAIGVSLAAIVSVLIILKGRGPAPVAPAVTAPPSASFASAPDPPPPVSVSVSVSVSAEVATSSSAPAPTVRAAPKPRPQPPLQPQPKPNATIDTSLRQ